MLNHGYLPRHYLNSDPAGLLRSYVADYLSEEIAMEGLVRSIPKFTDFLRAAALSDTEIINFSNIAEDCRVAPPTAKDYYQILVDTLLGSFLPAYTRHQKRKVVGAPKFYMADVAVVNQLAKRGEIILGSEQAGKAFENWMYHELKAFNHYKQRFNELRYWRLAGTQHEVDFIIGDMDIAIEAKTAHRIAGHHLKSLYELLKDNPQLKRVLLVCREPKRRLEGGKIEIVPYQDFLEELWEGRIV
jgi:predicted AAA+ superfamily ATPase